LIDSLHSEACGRLCHVPPVCLPTPPVCLLEWCTYRHTRTSNHIFGTYRHIFKTTKADTYTDTEKQNHMQKHIHGIGQTNTQRHSDHRPNGRQTSRDIHTNTHTIRYTNWHAPKHTGRQSQIGQPIDRPTGLSCAALLPTTVSCLFGGMVHIQTIQQHQLHMATYRQQCSTKRHTQVEIPGTKYTYRHTYNHTGKRANRDRPNDGRPTERQIEAYIQTYMQPHTHTYIRIYRQTHTDLTAEQPPHIHTYIHIHIHTFMHTFIHAYIHTHIRTHTPKHIHIAIQYIHKIYAYQHTHIHAYIQWVFRPFSVCPTDSLSVCMHDAPKYVWCQNKTHCNPKHYHHVVFFNMFGGPARNNPGAQHKMMSAPNRTCWVCSSFVCCMPVVPK